MDLELCRKCKYYIKAILFEYDICGYDYMCSLTHNGSLKKCKSVYDNWYDSVYQCKHFKSKRQYWGHYEVDIDKIPPTSIITLGDGKVQNSDFRTTLRSYNEKKSYTISSVDINCDNFETFKKIVEAVMPILEKEDIKDCE